MTHQPRPEDIEAYVVYRFRLAELILLFGLWHRLKAEFEVDRDIPPSTRKDLASVVGVATMVWLHSFFDPKALNLFELWPAVFPWRRPEVEALKGEIQAQLNLLARFRHSTGAHAARKIEAHNKARQKLGGPEMTKAVDRFVVTAKLLMEDEEKVPALAKELEEWNYTPGGGEPRPARRGVRRGGSPKRLRVRKSEQNRFRKRR